MHVTQQQTAPLRTPSPRIAYWQKQWWLVKRSPLTLLGAAIIAVIVLMMVFAPWLAPYDPNAIDFSARLQPPSSMHWFGTDEVGRDLFSRVVMGSQQSVAAGLAVVAIAAVTGSLLGCFSGVLGGFGDAVIMRVMDIMLSIPSLVLTMALAAALAPACSTPCWRLPLCVSRFMSGWRAGKRWWCVSLPMFKPRKPSVPTAGI